jgi:hypothetical protein
MDKRQKGSTKIQLTKREEFCVKKYRKAITALLDISSKFYYKKYLHPEDENAQYSRKDTRSVKLEP